MKSYSCWLAASLLALAPCIPVLAQCESCGPHGGPSGPVLAPEYRLDHGGFGPAPFPRHSLENCDPTRGPCGLYASEQEKLDNDWCQCCIVNWGYDFKPHNALTPRFRPTWHFAADALFLQREGDRFVPFASLGPRQPGGRNVVLSSDNFPACLEGGVKGTLSHGIGDHDNLLIEGVYLGMHEWNEMDSFRDATPNSAGGLGILTSPFTNLGQPQVQGFDFNTLATISYFSELESMELNLRHRVGLLCGPLETSLLYGVRYMRIGENFSYRGESTVPLPLGASNQVDVATSNDLVGFQVGGLSSYRVSDRWWFELDVKAALCQNNNDQETLYTNVAGGVTSTFAGNAQQACTAFIGDVNLMSIYQITPWCAVRAGYQAIWVDGVAVAVENFSNSIPVLTLGPAEVNDNGTLVYHGPHLGAVLTW